MQFATYRVLEVYPPYLTEDEYITAEYDSRKQAETHIASMKRVRKGNIAFNRVRYIIRAKLLVEGATIQ